MDEKSRRNAVDRAVESLCAQVSPDTLAHVQKLHAQGDHKKADYWLSKALRLNTRRGIQRAAQAVALQALQTTIHSRDGGGGNGTQGAA
jgi:hypothetical protein